MKQKQQQSHPVAVSRRAAAATPMIESLEKRQLMHAVVDLRVAGGGGNAVTVTTVGQEIDFEIWVTITGHNASGADEALQAAATSLLSTNISGGAANGTLAATLAAPFNGSGSHPGTAVDLDGDGDLDIGRSDNSSDVGFHFARSASMETDGTIDGGSNAFKIGQGTFTVTALNNGIQTNLVARPRSHPTSSIVFTEDGVIKNEQTGGIYTAGAGIVLKREGTASLAGRVFDDKNASGFFDTGIDDGVSGFRVFLDEDFDGVLDADETSKPVSTTGTYTFSNVVAGVYRVTQVPRSGWRTSFPGEGYYEVPLGYGQAGKSLSFANTQGVLIKGTVWHDSNADRVLDPIEDRLSRWRVIVDLNENGVWDEGDISKETNGRGQYRLSLLLNGTFTVMARQIEGYRQTTNGGFPREITLGPGETTSNKNFGFKRLKVT